MADIMPQIEDAARRTLEKYPNDKSDTDKAGRAVEGYELGYLPMLREGYTRQESLRKTDKLFRVSERHVRRVETIRYRRSKEHAARWSAWR